MSSEEITASRLAEQLREPGHRVVVADPDSPQRAAWRRAIDALRREGRVPPGQRLRHIGRDHGDLVIWLEEAGTPVPPRPDPLEVPEVVERPHRVLGSVRDLVERLDIDEVTAPRALRMLQAFLEAAEAHGFAVDWGSDSSTLLLARDGHTERVRCYEEREHREVVPSDEELGDDAPRYPWQRVRTERRLVATGRLCLELVEERPRSGRRARWADRNRWRLEDRLADVLAEVERRTAAAVAHRRAREDEARRREAQWHEAMDAARRAFAHQRRRETLLAQLEAWTTAERVRGYAAALSAADTDPGRRDAVEAWAGWACSYADAIDPIVLGELAPDEVEPSPEQLRPHLGGWSPHGPDQP